MKLEFLNFIFLVVTTIIVPCTPAAAWCNHSCGGRKLPFPFGFSPGCPIQLNCTSNGTILAAEFPVQSVSGDTILVNLPPMCGRPVEALRRLFTANFAPTSHNAILLQNCRNSSSGCFIPSTMVQTHFELLECEAKNDSISCYSETNNATSFIDYNNLTRSGCRSLFSAISMESFANSSSVSLDVQIVRMGWWLHGACRCSENAKCVPVTPPVEGSPPAYRCECLEGFAGDGFRDGMGCRKESLRCNPSKYLSGECGGTTRVGVLVGGVAAGASLMISLGLVFCFIRKRSKLRSRSRKSRQLCETTGITVPNEVNLAALAVDRIGRGHLDEIIDPFLEPTPDAWTLLSVQKVAELAFRCLAFHKDMRPSMMEVAIELEQIRLSKWTDSDTGIVRSSEASSRSSSSNLSDKPLNVTVKKHEFDSAGLFSSATSLDTTDFSPVSADDSWQSDQSSPSSNSLLNRVIR
ncbi:Wall-associated receptor kinase-like 14 [Sesamum alatum]|uniref:Wall-associated receptor kinase-like 14 n=1 Tax=Sesamum alatum TaxID=300844 RepID=A0AAE1YFH8_9LAMI|nr:Wall-associated receptor kinase-like 14 [Sesamum alatum]